MKKQIVLYQSGILKNLASLASLAFIKGPNYCID